MPVSYRMEQNRSLTNDRSLEPDGVLPSFDFAPRTRVIFANGAIERLGEVVCQSGGRHVLLVTDPGIERAGHGDRSIAILRNSGLKVTVYDDVTPNPTSDDVGRALRAVENSGINLIVGLGGGSSMDCAKGVNFLLTNGGKMEDYCGIGKATKPMLPMIAIPTTAGTGSEAQSYALIADPKTHMKMACGDKKSACRVAILDPELTLSMPQAVTAATGIDAISHAIETFVTTRRNPMSQMFSRRAWQLLSSGFPRVLDDPDDLESRGTMLLGANLAGAAIENSMLGAAHALSNPLSAHFNLTHGFAVGIMLPHVIRYNSQSAKLLYGPLAADAELCNAGDPAAGGLLADFIGSLVKRAGCQTDLTELNIEESLLSQLAEEAAAQWTGTCNPRPVNAAELMELYRCACTLS